MSKKDLISKEKFLKEIGYKIKEIRDSKGLSQFKLAIEYYLQPLYSKP